jgi:receptor expression-enhancing protein 5/6
MSFTEKFTPFQTKILQAMDRHPFITQRDVLKKLERQTKYSRAWILCSIVVLIVIVIYFLGGIVLITRLVGFVYPAFESFKAIDTPNVKDNELWLSYWVIYSSLGVLEPIARPLFDLIPLYPLVKMAFLMWCYNPNTKGANVVYYEVIRPFILPLIGITSKSTLRSSSKAVESISRKAGTIKDECEIEVDVIGASDLPAMESGKTDAYVLIFVQTKDGSLISDKCKTRVKPSTTDPKWNEKMTMRFRRDDAKPGSMLMATVCHKTPLGQDMLIGRVSAPLTQFSGEGVEGEYTLTDKDKENPVGVSGSLRMGISYNAESL